MSNTQYTADELRKEACYWQAKAERIREMGATKFTVQHASDLAHAENADKLLRAGADAMDRLNILESALEIQGGEMMTAIDKAVKAEARVKVLEEALNAYANYPNIPFFAGTELYDKARAALQVKP